MIDYDAYSTFSNNDDIYSTGEINKDVYDTRPYLEESESKCLIAMKKKNIKFPERIVKPKFDGKFSSYYKWNIFKPRYQVNWGNWFGGRVEPFYRFDSAWKFAIKKESLFVNIYDYKDMRSLHLRNVRHNGKDYEPDYLDTTKLERK